MPVAVLGMHRSGTSMVMNMLRECGLFLGDPQDLFLPGPDNSDGYWEHAGFHGLNEWILSQLGGGWDDPPPPPESGDARLEAFPERAEPLLRQFDGREPWGWKDPRTSLTLPLWREALPELRVVLCIRHPLEVALSLNRRGMSSYGWALKLWRTYNERILDVCGDDELIVTDYGAYFARGRAELRRVLSLLGMEAPERVVARAAALRREGLRHTRFDLGHLLDARVAPDIVELYQWLRSEASGGRGHRTGGRPAPTDGSGPLVDQRHMEDEVARLDALALMAEVKQLREALSSRDTELAVARAREQALTGEIERLHRRSESAAGVAQRVEDLHTSFQFLETELIHRLSATDGADAYAQQLQRLKEVVRTTTPVGSAIAVVSRGDERLLGLYGRRGMHYPQTDDGTAAGRHPASGLPALAHLEVMRARGADYLLIPAIELWWLEHYPDLHRHLASRYSQLLWDAETCVLFGLQGPDAAAVRRREAVELVEAVGSALRAAPTVVDWGTGADLARALPNTHALAQTPAQGPLPYPDGGADVVAVANATAASIAEARRVARTAVMALAHGRPASVRLAEGRTLDDLRDVSVIALCPKAVASPASLANSLRETLPSPFQGELILLSDDQAADARELAAATGIRRTRLIGRTAVGGSALAAGAQAARGEVLVFLGADQLLLPGWLRPLRDLLRDRPQAGLVTGRLLLPDGSLAESGRSLLRDGSLLRSGYGEADPDTPPFAHVRRVDCCGAGLFAIRRSLVDDLGGFDPGWASEDDAVADLCLAVARGGASVLVQPRSAAVRRGSGNPRPDDARLYLPDARLRAKWRPESRRRPPLPPVADVEALRLFAATLASGP